MEIRELTCIGCPMGCTIKVELEENRVVSITGNTCNRGKEYAQKEVTDPTRIVTSSVPVTGGCIPQVSVKTDRDIPKRDIFNVMKALKGVRIEAPVQIGDAVISNVAGTGADIVATKDVGRD